MSLVLSLSEDNKEDSAYKDKQNATHLVGGK